MKCFVYPNNTNNIYCVNNNIMYICDTIKNDSETYEYKSCVSNKYDTYLKYICIIFI